MNVRFKLRGASFDSEDGRKYDSRDYWLTDNEILKFEIFHGKKRRIPTILFFLIPLSWFIEILLLPSISSLPVASFFLGVLAIYLANHYLVAAEREALDRLSRRTTIQSRTNAMVRGLRKVGPRSNTKVDSILRKLVPA